MPPRYQHLVFDLDGTLADTRADLVASVNYALQAVGLPPRPPEQVTSYVGNGARILIERALGAEHHALTPRALETFMAHYRQHLLDTTRAYPGIPELLAGARRSGIALTVLTNKPEAPSRAILGGLGIDAFFAGVIGGDTLPARKPDPRGVHELQRRTGVPPGATLLVGDSRVDCETARAAGIAMCGVTWGFNPETLKPVPPDIVVDAPAALLDLLQREP